MPRPATHPIETMLIRRATLDGIAAGRIRLVFRRWTKPTVRAGGRLRTAVGVLAIDAVEPVVEAEVSQEDARLAGYASRDDLLVELAQRPEGTVYRIRLRMAGPDPRIALRAKARLTAAERGEVAQRLASLDATSPRGPWTLATLRLIAERPGVRAGDLAVALGVETLVFKRSVRHLKELGLTEALGTGYRLSPRGRAFLDDG